MKRIIIEIDDDNTMGDEELLDMLITLCSYTNGLTYTVEEG